MKITISDKRAFSALSPLEVRAYLQANGWEVFRVLEGLGSYWRRPGKGETAEVPLPNDKTLGDYADRMRELVEKVSEIENRSVLQVLADLERAGQDVVRVRLVGADIDDGSVPLEHGVGLMEAAREAMYAAALAAFSHVRRAYYASRPPKQVSDYMDCVRLGQTERGSYVVTIESPVAPTLDGATEDIPDPFERRVTKTLTSALSVLREAADKGSAKGIQEAVSFGVSANLCDAIAKSLHLSGSQGEVEVRVSWARTRGVPSGSPHQIAFPSYLVGVISEAAKLLKASAEIDSYELAGTVHQLRQDTDVVILGWVDDRLKKVRVAFSPEHREQLIKAFEDRSIIRCEGELRQSGKVTELLNPRNLSLDDSEDVAS